MVQSNPQMYTVDLASIDGDGDFPCTNCGVMISPEDQTENVYTIIDTKIREGELIEGQPPLEELTIQCNKCGSKIRLIGFVQ